MNGLCEHRNTRNFCKSSWCRMQLLWYNSRCCSEQVPPAFYDSFLSASLYPATMWAVSNHFALAHSLCVILTSPPWVFPDRTRDCSIVIIYVSMFHSIIDSRFCELWTHPPLTGSLNRHTCLDSLEDIVYIILRSCSKIWQYILCGFEMKIPLSCTLASYTYSYTHHDLH